MFKGINDGKEFEVVPLVHGGAGVHGGAFAGLDADYDKVVGKAVNERAALVEKVGELDDEVMEMFIDGLEVPPAVLKGGLRRITMAGGKGQGAVAVSVGKAAC